MHEKDAGIIISAEGGSAAFETLDLLDQGRTAEIYLVRDTRSEREQVPLQLRIAAVTHQMPETYALKIARDARGESLAHRNARISCEQEVLERLLHPGIVRSGTGGWHEGRAFFAMELLEGPGLARFLGHERRSYREHMRLFLRVTEAIARCHERGVVHRDLRPGNVTVEPDRGPVLFDFESSALVGAEECAEVAVGAAEYAPPDYLAYVLEPSLTYVNHPRGDVYSLGAFLNSLLTGRVHVVRGSEGLVDYLLALRDFRPVSPRLINPEVPPACAALALRLMSRDRPATAREVPRLVREALLEDPEELDRLAPHYTADTETLLSSTHLPARRRVSVRWRPARRALRRHVRHLVGAALLVATAVWMLGSGRLQLHGRAMLDARMAGISRIIVKQYGVMARAVAQLKALFAGAHHQPPAAVVQKVALGALKMPQRPEAFWLKPRADGLCYDPVSGRELRTTVVLRGACWTAAVKTKPEYSCPDSTFDAPPEVETTPQLQHLRNHCFSPVLNPQPQASKLEK